MIIGGNKMELIHTALLLNKAGREVNEANVKKVLEAAGIKEDEGKIKALITALEGVNIEEVVKANKPLTPQQARIKSLQTQKDNASKQLKAERDRQKIQRAQQQIHSVISKK